MFHNHMPLGVCYGSMKYMCVYMYVCMYVANPNNSRLGLDKKALNTRCKNQLSFQLRTSQLFRSNYSGFNCIMVCLAIC